MMNCSSLSKALPLFEVASSSVLARSAWRADMGKILRLNLEEGFQILGNETNDTVQLFFTLQNVDLVDDNNDLLAPVRGYSPENHVRSR